MIVAGVMSGTSADGINVALVRVDSPAAARKTSKAKEPAPQFHLLGHAEYPYPKEVRGCVLRSMNAARIAVADLARLNFLLGELYADAVLETQRRFHMKVELIGCHGQTLYHQGEPELFLGRKLATTWQTGEAAVIAARVGVPVISDFRVADMAVRGKGAPLVPFLDYLLYRDPRIGRVVQNIGGIANLTAIPPRATSAQVMAFDTGPGNMVIDAVMEHLFNQAFDRDGQVAASGNVLQKVLNDLLWTSFFKRKPPKTAGREEFGQGFLRHFLWSCGRAAKQDVVATATALTAKSIADALRRFVTSKNNSYREFIVSGGGAKNPTLLAMLANELGPMGLEIRLSDEFGLPAEAKEAVAFALLAYQTWNRRPSNVPSATGASKPAILGKISYA
jgi:anhydro-N-acetylmuramic acid kinase